MRHVIIGTAGHVDHGKTALVKALTGQETDRLKEEKERGISIELGFASYQLANGLQIGLVDVPGHERFIKHMLAGVAGIDLVLLIIAADEGVMPQTREHLDIISLLNVTRGIVVITKTDLVEEEWLELITEDIQGLLAKTVLKDAPVVRVSAKTGQGLAELQAIIAREVAGVKPKAVEGRPRLPIDRVFSVTGFGTVVTGTLWSGKIRVGDKLVLYPRFLEAKVRNIQVHGKTSDEALAGQRAAVNLGNISLAEIERGDVLAAAGMLVPAIRLDVELILLARMEKKLVHRQRVRVHLGTTEALGRVVLLDREELRPGEKALAQLALESDVVALSGDRFVIRSYSPMVTIGGGTIIDPEAKKVKRYREEALEKMLVKLEGSPEERLYQLVKEHPFIEKNRLAQLADLDQDFILTTAKQLAGEGTLKILSAGEIFVTNDFFEQLTTKARGLLANYHRQYPLRQGMPREELRTRLDPGFNQKCFSLLLADWLSEKLLLKAEDKIGLPEHPPAPSGREERQVAELMKLLIANPFQPPLKKELTAQIKAGEEEMEELLQYLVMRGETVKITEELYLSSGALTRLQAAVAELYQRKGEIVLGEVRDITGSSRKYVLPFLEYLDQIKYTKRIGDKRVLY